MHWQFGEMEFGEMKRNTSNWSNFGMLLRRAGLKASAGLSCIKPDAKCTLLMPIIIVSNSVCVCNLLLESSLCLLNCYTFLV